MTPARRQNHGLALWIRRRVTGPPTGRDLVGAVSAWGRRPDGTCIWCEQPLDGPRHWHPECGLAYAAARGRTETLGGSRVIPRTPCACGATASEIDHILPLGVAIRNPTVWNVARAWSVRNLQWICRPCHRAKTRQDRRQMSRTERGVRLLEAPQPSLFGGTLGARHLA